MKQFLIKYRHTNGTTEDWHKEIASSSPVSTAIRRSRARSAIAA